MNYLFFLQNLREKLPQWITLFFCFISEFGLYFSPFIALFIFWCINKKIGMKIIFYFITGNLLTNTIKNIACIYRPWILDSRLYVYPKVAKSASGYSFPSGHTTISSTCFFGIAQYKRQNKFIFILCLIFPFFVAFSRNWVGAHTFKDVFVGLSLSAIIVFLLGNLFDKIQENTKNEVIFLISSFVVSIGLFLFTLFKKYPMDYSKGVLIVNPKIIRIDGLKAIGSFLGFVISSFIEKHFVKYEVPKKLYSKILVLIFGFITYILNSKFLIPKLFTSFAFKKTVYSFIEITIPLLIYPLCVKLISKLFLKK